MDVPAELGRIKTIQFLPAGSADVVRRTPRKLTGLDLAEMKLIKGDPDGAGALAKQALDQHTADPGRANFILARVAAMHGQMPEAEQDFAETIKLSKDPRILAWSHIYLGRVYDIKEQRQQAVTEYHAALTVRDGQADTRIAAEKGIKQPYALPPGARKPDSDDDDDTAPPPTTTAPATTNDPSADTAPRPNAPPLSSIPGAAQATRPHN
jgi:tetratricopeptide (TPR) repeat protein